MTQSFIGRGRELKKLSLLHQKKSASLVVVSGRRRIGKSRLIEEFVKEKSFFSFSAILTDPEVEAQDQRNIFAQRLGKQIGIGDIPVHDCSPLFSLLARQTNQGSHIILLDEISWMGSKDPLFLGKLKNAWDLEFTKNPKLILILCGSVSKWMEKNIISSTGFFGRISLFLKVEELPLDECHEFLLKKGFRQSTYEEFKLLGITGGIPWYLEQVQANLDTNTNIKDPCFQKEAVLFHEFDSIFHELFERRNEIYRSIIKTLAHGAMEFKEICKSLKYSKSGTLSEYLDELIQFGFVSRDYTWSIKSGKRSKLSHYRLSDNYLRFYLKYIFPNKDKILRGYFEDGRALPLSGWNAMMGLQFENLALNNRKRIWEQLAIRPEHIVSDNPYFQKSTSKKAGVQIDYLIQTRFNTLFACEIKFSTHPIRMEVIDEMKSKLAKISLPKRFSCWPVLIHVNGVSDQIQDSDYFSKIVDFSSFLSSGHKL